MRQEVHIPLQVCCEPGLPVNDNNSNIQLSPGEELHLFYDKDEILYFIKFTIYDNKLLNRVYQIWRNAASCIIW